MSSSDAPEASASSAPPSPSSAEAESEAEAEVDSTTSEPSAESGLQSDAEAEVGSNAGAESEPSAESGCQSEAEEAEVVSNSGAESEPCAESCLQSEAEAVSDAETGVGTMSIADSVSGTQSGTETASASSSASEAADSASEAASSDSDAERPKKSGKKATAASASERKSQKDTPLLEKFEANAFGTLAEHVASHSFPAFVATCGPCHFWKNRWTWSVEFSSLNPVSKKNETWLGSKNGMAVCFLCYAHKGSKSKSQIGKGQGSLLRKLSMQRHATCAEHKAAVEAWRLRLRSEATGIESFSEGSKAPATAAAVSSSTPQPTNCRAIVATRALVETRGSFGSFEVLRDALVGKDEREALESQWHLKRLTTTMAQYEKVLTQRLLREGAVFRLKADGLARTYQVEIGTVLWSLPAFLKDLPAHGEQAGWLEVLGPRGPWIVERIIGMQEFPHGLGEDGKVSMLEACVRRACRTVGGEVDTMLLQHVRDQTRAWCSDGADLKVPLAASAFFPRLAFISWDEAHSAQRLGANAKRDDDEIEKTDKLLVTGKKPYSLAKFLSTSMVFRKTVGDAQLADEVAFVKNFGWAPQRFNSQARPYARASRRWHTIFESVATEAAGGNKDRRVLARMFLEELGGENSSRLALGGMLADLSAEHYSWVATGDKQNPDATTVETRADAFLARLDKLFLEGMILTLPDTFTGTTLKFLSKTSYFRYGDSVQTVGIGDWTKDETAKEIIMVALRRVRVVVKNMKEYMKVYRSKNSWLHAFAAFRLPSPLSASDEAGRATRADVWDSLRSICREAELPEDKACNELLELLPRAEKHHLQGCHNRVAWARAAAEWHEFSSARQLVELHLIWTTSCCNLERRFRRLQEVCAPGRAKLLDTTIEDIMIVEQAPPSKMLRTLMPSVSAASASLPRANGNPYFQRVSKLHEKLHCCQNNRIRVAERRDTGVARGPAKNSLGPDTEAAFGRKREAAIADVVSASSSKKARMIRNAHLGLSRVAQEAADENARSPAVASAAVVSKVAKREGETNERNGRGARAAAKARLRREKQVAQSATRPPKGRDQPPARKAGIMLVRLADDEARLKARQLRFSLTMDPLDFVAKVLKVPSSSKKGHVVLASPVDTDFAQSARIAAALLGCFYATPQEFVKDGGSPSGIMYTEKYRNPKHSFHVAVSTALAAELPTLPQLLKAIALAPGSCFKFYLSERNLCKFFHKTVKTTPRILQRTCVLCKRGDRDTARKKYKDLYLNPRSFLLRFDASELAVCPGCRPT